VPPGKKNQKLLIKWKFEDEYVFCVG